MTPIERLSFRDESGIARHFEKHGLVIINDLLRVEDLTDVREDIKHLIQWYQVKAGLPKAQGDDTFTSGLQSLEKTNREYVGAVYDTIYQMPSFMRLISNPLIEHCIKGLLGLGKENPLYGYTNRCLFAPPFDERRTYGWHQEVFYTVPDSRYIQTFAPLVFDTTTSTGTIEVCLGSHKEGLTRQEWREEPGSATQVLVDCAIVNKYPQVSVEMKLGELALFSGFMIHRSGKNTSDRVRYSLVGMFHDVSHNAFVTPKISFTYRKKTPREYYEETFA
jgi:ectoine hydroxylase-related dioxygenase (phytanoyl-CoA dioxygenase family)